MQTKQWVWSVSGLRFLYQWHYCFEEIPERQVENTLSTEQAEILNWSDFYFSLEAHLAYRKMRECWGRGKQCHLTQKTGELFASFVFIGVPAIKGELAERLILRRAINMSCLLIVSNCDEPQREGMGGGKGNGSLLLWNPSSLGATWKGLEAMAGAGLQAARAAFPAQQ